jgi:hypothetical protein
MPYPTVTRKLAQRIAPGLMADRARRYERDFRERQGVTVIARELVGSGPMEVQAGPFTGMRYPSDRVADIDAPVAKMLGTYEQELRNVFTEALADELRTFVDVGCADGYYAVGMPYADRRLMSYAFDLSPSARDLCRVVARINALEDRVRIGTRFTARSLDVIDDPDALLLCDIEGAEGALFDANLVGRLSRAIVVIEVHEKDDPSMSARLRDCFDPSHTVDRVNQQPRETLRGLPPLAFEENRPQTLHWLVCRPRLA